MPDFKTQILVASVRHPVHVVDAAKIVLDDKEIEDQDEQPKPNENSTDEKNEQKRHARAWPGYATFLKEKIEWQ